MSLAAALLLVALGPGGDAFRPILPGLERRTDERGNGVVTEALRIDPKRFRLEVVLASELGKASATAREFATAKGALLAVNGGFFDAEGKPLGLRVSAGERVAGRLNRSLGAFVVSGGKARILLGRDLERSGPARELLQSGPRLVVGGKPNRLKPQTSRRSVAGLDAAGRVVLLVTSAGMYEAGELADWLAAPESEGGLALVEALNLDGGGSTQLYFSAADTELDVPGLTGVSDALVVLPGGVASRR